MSTSIGNWTISTLYKDTISNPKSLSIPDLDYAHDFSGRVKLKGRTPSANADEQYYVNNTGESITSPEQTVYGRQPIANVYNNLDVDATAQLPQKGGHRVYCTDYVLYSAVNSVSGAEVMVPLRGTFSIDVPDASLVTQSIVEDFQKRLVSHMFGTSQVNGDMVAKMLRGDIDPTR